jgi:2-amino-4-hydroxy-6-hydroxymethyldihydropteridine diphosphokinase
MTAERLQKGTTAYVALGSNIENREVHLEQAISRLDATDGVEVLARSSVYETEPVGYTEQSRFLNMVISIRTTMPAEQLLHVMLNIEQQLGRQRDIHWGPRTIDLDLLLYGEEEISSPELIVPHPRMLERAFVLIPLAEILYHRCEPSLEFISAQLEKLDGKEGVVLWKKAQ